MSTYFLRSHLDGEIAGEVEAGDMIAAMLLCEQMDDDLYPDQRPPFDVLERYHYRSHR